MAPSFTRLCRVADSKFSCVSADALMELRATVDPHAVGAFNGLCSRIDPAAAERASALFDRTACTHIISVLAARGGVIDGGGGDGGGVGGVGGGGGGFGAPLRPLGRATTQS